MCELMIDWCKTEKLTFLRNRIEIKLAALFLVV